MQLTAAAVTPPAEHAARRPAGAARAAAADAGVRQERGLLTSCVHVIEQTDIGPLIRIEVSGDWSEGAGDELAALVRTALAEYNPCACCIDLCQVYGFLRADTLGGLLPAIASESRGVVRPISIAARGGTARSVRWFLEASRVSELGDVMLFADALEAVKYLQRSSGHGAV